MSSTPLLNVLNQLGEIQQDQEWLDYSALGVIPEDSAELVSLIGNTSFQQAEVDSNEVWVPQHAWRALGQVGGGQDVANLLAQLDSGLLEDVWAGDELPVVIGMIGAEGLEALANHLAKSDASEVSRIVCAEGLKCVVEETPTVRDPVVAVLSRYLEVADVEALELNGIVVCCLIDLEAKEAIERIRTLFERNIVDVSYTGDIEDVELELGLRVERETPRSVIMPSRSKGAKANTALNLIGDTSLNLDDELDEFFSKYRNSNSITNISELDGFLAALGCAPDSIALEDWLPSIWGGEQDEPQWSSKDESDQFVSAVMVTYKRVMKALNSDTYAALFVEEKKEVDGKQNRILVADDWCNGFMRGVNLWSYLGTVDNLFLKENLQSIRLFVTDSGRERLKVMSYEGIEQQLIKIENSVRHMYQHWLNRRQMVKQPQVNSEPKVGRNDPCPCGSGKKFKKCCLH